jgi:hypothetical protein
MKSSQTISKNRHLLQMEQKARTFALIGTILTCVALVFRGVGFYQAFLAVSRMKFEHTDNLQEISEVLGPVTQALAKAGDTLSLGNWVMLVGGASITYAMIGGRFRERWFFWSTLAFGLLVFWQPVVGSFFGLWWFWLLFWNRNQFFLVKQAIFVAA